MHRLLLALAAVVAAFVVGSAEAQQRVPCYPTDRLEAALRADHDEQAIMRGVTPGGDLIVVYANPDSGSWTLVVQRPGGISCMLGHGEAFEALPYHPPEAVGGDA